MRTRMMRARSWTAVAATVVLLGACLSMMPAVAAVESCTEPPEVFPLQDLEKGMMTTGWTVIDGTEPVSFDVEIIGVQPDAIVPGFPVIAVKASGPAIEQAGGIAAGFSGSPVYRADKLVGSVSWVMGWGADPHYGGLTPGALMVDILGYPSGRPGRATTLPARIPLRDEIRRAIARDAGTRLAAVPNGLDQIPLPVVVSGTRHRPVREIARRFERGGTPVVAYRAGSAPAPVTPTSASLRPGDAVAATISYGDITVAGIGTATIVCGDLVVAFGHPFDHAGARTAGGLNGAEILTTVPGDEPFKLGNVGGFHGRLDQDRLAGIRGVEGVMPSLIPVTSTIANRDTGRSRHGETQLAVHSAWLRRVAAYHHEANVNAILDAERGTVDATWTIELVVGGKPLTIEIDDMLAGRWISYRVWDVTYSVVRSIQNVDEPNRFELIDLDAQVTQAIETAQVEPAATSSTTEPTLEVRRALDVARDDLVRVRIPLEPVGGGATVYAWAGFRVPEGVRGDGELRMEIGEPDYSIKASTIEQLAWRLEHQAGANEIEVAFTMRGMDEPIVKHLSLDWVLKGDLRDVQLNLVGR